MISVLDTTAVSAAMRQDSGIVSFLRQRRPGDVATVPPVVAEIEYGIRRIDPSSRKRALLERELGRVLRAVRVLPWTSESSRLFGSFKADLERSGNLIDDFDIAIAAISAAHGAEVVTANLVPFSRIHGLAVRAWQS